MEKIFACCLLFLLFLHVAFGHGGAERECDKNVKEVFGFCEYGDDDCYDICEGAFEDYQNAQILGGLCIAGANVCKCRIRSNILCDVPSPASAPSPFLAAHVDFRLH
ncbi:hypothetical protein U1Q18_006282 [Sarracenia purpurea var. burkii]